MDSAESRAFRVLFLCTHNSARSQIAEALLRARGGERFEAASAGSDPADDVHPFAREIIRSLGSDPDHHRPKSCDEMLGGEWDLVITVCDRARESCPTFRGRPAIVHWGMADPAAVEGPGEVRRRAFSETATVLARRIDLLRSLPVEKLERLVLQQRLEPAAEGGEEE